MISFLTFESYSMLRKPISFLFFMTLVILQPLHADVDEIFKAIEAREKAYDSRYWMKKIEMDDYDDSYLKMECSEFFTYLNPLVEKEFFRGPAPEPGTPEYDEVVTMSYWYGATAWASLQDPISPENCDKEILSRPVRNDPGVNVKSFCKDLRKLKSCIGTKMSHRDFVKMKNEINKN